jgi:hypothetical protein
VLEFAGAWAAAVPANGFDHEELFWFVLEFAGAWAAAVLANGFDHEDIIRNKKARPKFAGPSYVASRL